MSERNAAEAEIDRLLNTLGHLHPREAVQVLTNAVLHVSGGAVRDDVTVPMGRLVRQLPQPETATLVAALTALAACAVRRRWRYVSASTASARLPAALPASAQICAVIAHRV